MDKKKFSFLFLISLLFAFVDAGAQNSASAFWELKSDTTITAVTGDLTGYDEKLSFSASDPTLNLKVKDYTTAGGQRLNLGSTSWPKEEVENPGRYVVFAVKPKAGFNFVVTSITLDMGGGGTSYMNANTYYSTDPAFTQRIKLNSSTSLPNSGWLDPSPSYSTEVTIPAGTTFYLLVYPWYNTTPSTSKYIYLRNINVSGYTVPSSGVDFSVITSLVSDISFDSAVCGGNIISDGGNPVTERGVCWNESGNPTISDSRTINGSGIGSFVSYISGLKGSTKYFLRAYATNSTGTIYGDEVSFTTSPVPMLAFPGAEGYGRFTTGGRGGKVYEVTRLEDDNNPGSLRYAINQSGPRIIVFRVSGTIFLNSRLSIKNGDVTIAGQSAPGDGICIAGNNTTVSADNVIIRYMRFRLGDINRVDDDAFGGRSHKNIIIDHCSASWSVDETLSMYGNTNITIQWCIISESLNLSLHVEEGVLQEHGYGGIWGGENATFHHNLFAHHKSRNPRFSGGETDICVNADFRNNVIYNWAENSIYGGEKGKINIVGNYFKSGPATASSKKYRIVEPSDTVGRWFVDSNYVVGSETITSNNWSGGVQGTWAAYQKLKRPLKPFPYAEIHHQTAEEAYQSVLRFGGASLPARDSLDQRIITETTDGTAHFGTRYKGGGVGIIDSQNDVGGWPVLNSLPAPADLDHDGMPDDWETAHGLNPQDESDGSMITASGYSNVELYLNELVQGNVTAIEPEDDIPSGFSLEQNYPNPYNPETTIKFSIPFTASMDVETGHASSLRTVSLKVYDVLGREIATLVNETKAPGNYEIKFNGAGLASGIYFYRIQAGSFSAIRKMILMK